MKGFIFPGDRTIEMLEKPTPAPAPGQVLIQTRVSAICGSDLHYYRHSKKQRGAMAEYYSGHEPVGEVVAVGEGVLWPPVGERVVVYHVGGCGECKPCQVRNYKGCKRFFPEHAMLETRDGSNADYLIATAGQCLPLPEDFTYEQGAVLACNFGTAWGALRNALRFPGGTLAVWGLGPVGLNVVLIAKVLGVRVIGIDVSAGRREAAEQLGAETIDGTLPDLPGLLRTLTGDEGPHAVIDTTGVNAVHDVLVEAVRHGGNVVLVGLGQDSTVGPVKGIILKEVTVRGSWIYDISDWPEMLDFVRQHDLNLMSVVDRVVPISEFEEMIQLADSGKVAKILFTW